MTPLAGVAGIALSIVGATSVVSATAAVSGACPLSLASTPVAPPAQRPAPATPAPDPAGLDYRHRLLPTPFGWPRRDHWCVWVEPATLEGPAARWDQAWLQAVDGALASWAAVLPISRVDSPDQAQVLVFRRRPPIRNGRASHGRATLELALVRRADPAAAAGETQRLEPRVRVMVSPGQRPEAIEATALHELGHAFGLWGHSDDPADAMAAVPGARPVRQLSPRDRATVLWLQRQPALR
ncbi:MAG: peptidase [Cyanobacteriota bacterium]|nr:peptidase [Cyanobacteriota bacterium]